MKLSIISNSHYSFHFKNHFGMEFSLIYFFMKFSKINFNKTCLFIAAENGEFEVVKLLLSNPKIDVNMISISKKISE